MKLRPLFFFFFKLTNFRFLCRKKKKKSSAQFKITVGRIPRVLLIYTGLKYEEMKIEASDKHWSCQQEFLLKYLQMCTDGIGCSALQQGKQFSQSYCDFYKNPSVAINPQHSNKLQIYCHAVKVCIQATFFFFFSFGSAQSGGFNIGQ